MTPVIETAEPRMLSARMLGQLVGLSDQHINVALLKAGLIDGKPGAWALTEKGAQLAVDNYHWNGQGGHAHVSYDVRVWPETAIDLLDLSDTGRADIRQYLTDLRLQPVREAVVAAAAKRAADQRRLDALKRSAETAGSRETRKVLVMVGAAGVLYGASYGAMLGWRRRQRRAEARRRAAPPETQE